MSAQSKLSSSGKQTLEKRLAQHPELKAKIESLLSVVENAEGNLTQADAAEEQVDRRTSRHGSSSLGKLGRAISESHERALYAIAAPSPSEP